MVRYSVTSWFREGISRDYYVNSHLHLAARLVDFKDDDTGRRGA